MQRRSWAATLVVVAGVVAGGCQEEDRTGPGVVEGMTPTPIVANALSGLVSRWPGDGHANDVAGTNHGTLQNGAGFTAGKVGQAFSLDGLDDYVSLPTTRRVTGLSGVSIAAWIRRESGNTDDVIYFEGVGGNTIISFTAGPDGKLGLGVRPDATEGNSRAAFNSTTLLPTAQWTFVVGTADLVTRSYKLYLNGAEVTTTGFDNTTRTTFVSEPNNVHIGIASFFPDAGFQSPYHGSIDELEIYNRVLSASDILTIYQAGTCTVPAITAQPASATRTVGEGLTFAVTATGTGLTYQWRRNGADITGATAASFTIPSVQLADAGSYDVVVTGGCGSETSATAVLVVKSNQTISFAATPDKIVGTPPFALTATASSGLAVSFSLVSGPATISGNTVTLTGLGTVVVRASQPGDPSYNPAPDVERSFAVVYDFGGGFFPPVDNPGPNEDMVNRASAGRGIPVKFSLGGDQGLAIFADGYPKFASTPCDPNDTQDPIESTTTSPPGLSYDPVTEQYTYVWKTEKGWAGRCGTFQLGLRDGSGHHALFRFTK
jgi:hypothetical protein